MINFKKNIFVVLIIVLLFSMSCSNKKGALTSNDNNGGISRIKSENGNETNVNQASVLNSENEQIEDEKVDHMKNIERTLSQVVPNNIEMGETFVDGKYKIYYELADISDYEGDRVMVDVKYPILHYEGDKNIQKKVEELNDEVRRYAKNFRDDQSENVRTFIRDFTGDEEVRKNAKFEYKTYPTFVRCDENYLSIQMHYYQFTMGAHGSNMIVGNNYDVKNNKTLEIFDVIKNKDEFKQYLITELEKKYKEDLFDQYKDNIETYFNGEAHLQFVIKKDNSIIVYFQEYDVAPYASGILEIEVDRSMLTI